MTNSVPYPQSRAGYLMPEANWKVPSLTQAAEAA